MSDPTYPNEYPQPGTPQPYGQSPADPYSSPPVTPQPAWGQPPSSPPAAPAWGAPVPPPPSPYGQPAAQPYTGQPSNDPPSFGQPQSAQPYSGQPYSGQQPYSAQPFQGQYPGAVPPPAKKSRAGLWIAFAVVLVLLLGCGGLGVFLLASSDDEDPVATSSSSPSAVASRGASPSPAKSPTPKASPTKAAPLVTLTMPATLLGRAKLNDPQMNSVLDGMKTDINSGTAGRTGPADAAFYGSPEKNNLVMVVVVPATGLDPETELAGLFKGLGTSGDVQPAVDVPAGPLGGKAQCADALFSGTKVATCAWVDEGSLGMISFYFKTVSQVKADFLKARAEIEKK